MLSKIFNFDFISQQIPKMVTIADKVFDDLDKKSKNKTVNQFL